MMPEQKPGRSKQDYGTPREFLDAVERRFGTIKIDLAAHERNHVVSRWFGPGGEVADSFTTMWPEGPLLWLNPPFGNIEPWAARCAASRCRVLFLTPASVGANWFARHVHKRAFVLAIQGRLSFDGKSPFPKDCMLACFGWQAGFDVWDWRRT